MRCPRGRSHDPVRTVADLAQDHRLGDVLAGLVEADVAVEGLHVGGGQRRRAAYTACRRRPVREPLAGVPSCRTRCPGSSQSRLLPPRFLIAQELGRGAGLSSVRGGRTAARPGPAHYPSHGDLVG